MAAPLVRDCILPSLIIITAINMRLAAALVAPSDRRPDSQTTSHQNPD